MIGETIKALRCEKNYTQKELAEILNITPGCLSKYESDKILIPIDIVVKLSDIFNVSVDYLVGKNNFYYDYSVLNHYFVEKITLLEIVNNAISLSKEKRKTLYDVLCSLKCREELERYGKNKK